MERAVHSGFPWGMLTQMVLMVLPKMVLKTHISFDLEILPLGISPPEIIKDVHKIKLRRYSLTASILIETNCAYYNYVEKFSAQYA